MTTPEGRVKTRVRNLLSQYDGIYTYWPVPSGYGATTLDVLGCYRGRFFCIETKAADKKPTLRQEEQLRNIELAMGQTFVIRGEESPELTRLEEWLDMLTNTVSYAPRLSKAQVNRRPI